MSDAAKCDHCGTLYVPVDGVVAIEYRVRRADGYWDSYEPEDSSGSAFELCPSCSAEFRRFINDDREAP